MKYSRECLSKLQPKQISRLPVLAINFDNKEELRCLITDYVLHNIESEGRNSYNKKFKAKRIKYPSFDLKVNVNNQEKDISFDFAMILRKYLEFEKKNIYRDERIEPLVVDILNFLDQIDEKTKNVIFEIDPHHLRKLEEQVLNLIIQKHHKDKQKRFHCQQLDAMKKKIVAKHTRISYIDIEDQMKKKEKQFLLEVDFYNTGICSQSKSTPSQTNGPENIGEFGEKLLQLIESGEIFDNSQKVQELKREKILQFYNSNQIEYLNHLTQIKQQLNQEFPMENPSEMMEFLRDWVADITLSERYYQRKFQKCEKKRINTEGLEKLQNIEMDQLVRNDQLQL